MSAPTAAEALGPEVLERLARPEARVEARGKVTGAAVYADDRVVEGLLHARFLGSPIPHGRIRSIDTARARAMPGVRAVLTGADTGGRRFGRRLLDRPILVWDRVLFVGDRLAAVAADTPEIAEAAAAEIEVDLEELPPVLDVRAALAADAPVLHPDAASYVYLGGERKPPSHPNIQGRLAAIHGAGEDPEALAAVFSSAAHVFEHVFRTPREHAGYLEPQATIVWVDEAGVDHVWTTNKTPYNLRDQMAAAFGEPKERFEIEGGAIGGDFGGKGYTVNEYACLLLARATGRPVKAVASPADEFGAMNVRHASEMRLRTAVDADGRLLAHAADLLFDGGAYAGAKPLPHLSLAGGVNTLAAYRVPHVRIEARTVYTNTVPAGHVRSPGEVQALFAGESQLDIIARALGVDPLEFRVRNAVRPGEAGAAGDHFREVRAVEVLEAVRSELWDRPRVAGRGRGVALGVRHVGPGGLTLRLRLSSDGRIQVPTGIPDQGAGAATVIRRVLAATASVDEARISVVRTSTADSPQDQGVGGSRVTHLAGRAAQLLGEALSEWLDERLPAAVPTVGPGAHLHDDRLVDGATGETLATFDELAARLVEPGTPVELTVRYEAPAHGHDEPADYGFAATAVEVEVDRETGAVRLTDALLVADVGTVINPVAHRGQLEGGFAMGVGSALIEELTIDGGAVTSLSLADARLPASTDVPPLRIVQLPTTIGPGAFGSKMAGELNNAQVAPAVANAIADAIGVRVTQLPLTAERVLDGLDVLVADGSTGQPEEDRR